MSEFAATRSATVGPWTRPVAVPDDVDEPTIEKASGIVELPSWVRWSGPPRHYDLADRADRALVYEQVLIEGTDDDVRSFIVVDQLIRCGTSWCCLAMSVRLGPPGWTNAAASSCRAERSAAASRIVASLPEAEGFALAGGAALVIAEVVDRQTRDLDFFGATAERVDQLVPILDKALGAAGLEVSLKRANSGFAHFTVVDESGEVTEVDLGVDARIRPTETGPLGPMLTLEELAADKTLGLFGRAQARDFIDVAALVARLGFDRVCELAAEKDPGFSRPVLHEMLGSFDRLSAEDLGINESEHQRLATTVQAWRDLLKGGLPLQRPDRPQGLGL